MDQVSHYTVERLIDGAHMGDHELSDWELDFLYNIQQLGPNADYTENQRNKIYEIANKHGEL